jgi:hypothetical protein
MHQTDASPESGWSSARRAARVGRHPAPPPRALPLGTPKFDANGAFVAKWGKRGAGNGEFDAATDLTVDAKNNVYVIDYNHNRVQLFQQQS